MHYHLFVHGTNEYINPVHCVERGKKTGLSALRMVIAKMHFWLSLKLWQSKRKCCSNYENFKKKCKETGDILWPEHCQSLLSDD